MTTRPGLLQRLYPRTFSDPEGLGLRESVGLLVIRVTMGTGMAMHGVGKIKDPFGWAGERFPAPAQAIAAVSEFFGGIALAAGFLTPAAALGVFLTMLVAASTHIRQGQPFVGKGGSWELAAVYAAFAALLALVGPGRLSVDHALFAKRLRK
jgi:putative oxidoreductase